MPHLFWITVLPAAVCILMSSRILSRKLQYKRGISSKVSLKYADTFRYVSTDGEKITTPGKELKLPDKAEAPLSADSKAGEIIYLHPRNGQELGRIPILYAESVARLRFSDCLLQTFDAFCL